MCCKIVVYGNDKRQQSLANNLPGKRMEGQCQDPQLVILPTPLSEKNINEPFWKKVCETIKQKQPIVFAGKIQGQWQEFFQESNITYIDFMKSDKLAMENAHITAEAVLGLILTTGKYCISQEKYLVSGYGKCGRAITRKLLALGGKVTVLARSSEARKQARADGAEAVPFAYGPKEAYGCRVLINTVPQRVIGELIIDNLSEDCMIIDIASIWGVDQQRALERGISCRQELGLPARYMTETGGRVMAECLLEYLRSWQNNIEEMPWIYQIKE